MDLFYVCTLYKFILSQQKHVYKPQKHSSKEKEAVTAASSHLYCILSVQYSSLKERIFSKAYPSSCRFYNSDVYGNSFFQAHPFIRFRCPTDFWILLSWVSRYTLRQSIPV